MIPYHRFATKIVLSLSVLVGAVTVQASGWYEFRVNKSHEFYPHAQDFQARISYTVENKVPTIGLEQGAQSASKMYIEMYTMDHPGHCPQVALAQKFGVASSLVYEVALKYDENEKKCWGEVSGVESTGHVSPQGYTANYFQNPILLTIGSDKQKNTLYVRDSATYREFNFVLADSLN